MNIEYLKNHILPQREQEIKEGRNLCTRQPIYVVLDLTENVVTGHSEYTASTNYLGRDWEYGYIDNSLDAEDMVFTPTDEGMKEPKEITRFFTDRIIAFFLTSEAAHDYMDYQSHNLMNPYVYVFYTGYGNKQMDELFKGE